MGGTIIGAERLLEALAEAARRSGESAEQAAQPPANPDIDARLLLDAWRTFAAPCPYGPGTLLVPRADQKMIKASIGVACLLQVLPPLTDIGPPERLVEACDMIVLVVYQGDKTLAPIKTHSRYWQRYTGPVAPAAEVA